MKGPINHIEQINSALDQIRDVLKSTSEVTAESVSRVNELFDECLTDRERYRECIHAMDITQQDLFRAKTVKNWNGVELSVFTWETQFQRIISALEEFIQSCRLEVDTLNNQSLDSIRKKVEILLGEKALERVQCHNILLKTTLAIAAFVLSVVNAFADYSDHGRSYALDDDDAPYIPHPIIRVIGCAFVTLLAGVILYGKITNKYEKDDDEGYGKWIVFFITGILGVVLALRSCS